MHPTFADFGLWLKRPAWLCRAVAKAARTGYCPWGGPVAVAAVWGAPRPRRYIVVGGAAPTAVTLYPVLDRVDAVRAEGRDAVLAEVADGFHSPYVGEWGPYWLAPVVSGLPDDGSQAYWQWDAVIDDVISVAEHVADRHASAAPVLMAAGPGGRVAAARDGAWTVVGVARDGAARWHAFGPGGEADAASALEEALAAAFGMPSPSADGQGGAAPPEGDY